MSALLLSKTNKPTMLLLIHGTQKSSRRNNAGHGGYAYFGNTLPSMYQNIITPTSSSHNDGEHRLTQLLCL